MRRKLGRHWSPFAAVLVALLGTAAACTNDEDQAVAAAGGGAAGVGSGTGGTDGGANGEAGAGAGSSACAVQPPADWSAPEWDANATEALALRGQVSALTGDALMRGAETGAVTADRAALDAAYEAGAPSLASVSTEYFRGLVDDAFEEFLASLGAGAQDLVADGGDWSPGAEGGIWSTSTRAFNEAGLETRQIVDKGLFGGVLFSYALGLTTGTIDEATIDALAAAFGANPGLSPGRNDDAVAASQNTQSANYVYRMGFYAEARQALIDAKAYAADTTCAVQRDAAVQRFFRAWEQGLFARFAFYSHSGATKVAEATDDEGLAGALHDQAEGIGLALGFHGVPAPESGPMSSGARRMTDDRIAEALGALGVDVSGDLGDATLGAFVSDPLGYANAVRDVEAVIADVFSLTEAELESYRAPTDG